MKRLSITAIRPIDIERVLALDCLGARNTRGPMGVQELRLIVHGPARRRFGTRNSGPFGPLLAYRSETPRITVDSDGGVLAMSPLERGRDVDYEIPSTRGVALVRADLHR